MRRNRTAGAVLASALAAVTATAITTAAITVGLAQPAAAVPPPQHGYVWANQPAAALYVAATGYEYNSAGGVIDITRSGFGDYRVRFAGMALTGGAPHASAYGAGNSRFCTVAAWGQSGVDEAVRVRCFDGAGAPADSMFTASITDEKGGGRFTYAYANLPSSATWYVPAIQYDSTGDPIQVRRTALGRYEVEAAALLADTPGWNRSGYLRATAVANAPIRCEVLDPALGVPPYIQVRCYDIGGLPMDARFTVSYNRKVDVLGLGAPHGSALVLPSPIAPPSIGGWSSPGGLPTAVQVGVGSYQVSFPALANAHGYAIASAFGTPPSYCTVAGWWQAGGGETVWVQCYDAATHAPTPVFAFNVSFTH